jgi:hypothetical protein
MMGYIPMPRILLNSAAACSAALKGRECRVPSGHAPAAATGSGPHPACSMLAWEFAAQESGAPICHFVVCIQIWRTGVIYWWAPELPVLARNKSQSGSCSIEEEINTRRMVGIEDSALGSRRAYNGPAPNRPRKLGVKLCTTLHFITYTERSSASREVCIVLYR